MERHGFTTFGLAMPDVLKDYDNPIQSYRDYYHLDKHILPAGQAESVPSGGMTTSQIMRQGSRPNK